MSGDFDPRDVDSRERDDGIRDRDDQYLSLGRGGGGLAKDADDSVPGRDNDLRERHRQARDRHDDRGVDPRDVLVRDLDLPRGQDRELVHGRDRDYTLNGSESRTLATVGAFRVVSERDLADARGSAGDLRHLEDQGLIQRVPVNEQERAVTLTQDGRGLLERHRGAGSDHRQAFYAGADRARERTHDTQVYRAYLKAAERLHARERGILRIELDRELKREYQRFLQERNRGKPDSDGRPDRSPEEIAELGTGPRAAVLRRARPFSRCARRVPGHERRRPLGGPRGDDRTLSRRTRSGRQPGPGSRFTCRRPDAGGGAPFDPRVAEELSLMDLPLPPDRWDIDRLTEERTQAIGAFGFTPAPGAVPRRGPDP